MRLSAVRPSPTRESQMHAAICRLDHTKWPNYFLVRNRSMDTTPNSARFEQTFSDDEGKTWETNWAVTFKRLKAADKLDKPINR
jgi:hypothetical protein